MRLPVLVLLVAACRPPGYGKGDGVDAQVSDGHHGDGKAVDGAIDSPAATVCHASFSLSGYPNAASVWVTGSFDAWAGDPGGGAIVLMLSNGVWSGIQDFMAGTYQYKFIVDSTNWIADPANPNHVDDGFGGQNSLYTCTP